MADKNVKLKNQTGDQLFPQTKAELVTGLNNAIDTYLSTLTDATFTTGSSGTTKLLDITPTSTTYIRTGTAGYVKSTSYIQVNVTQATAGTSAVVPSGTQVAEITPSTTPSYATITAGYTSAKYWKINAISTESKTVSSVGLTQTYIYPTSGKYISSITVPSISSMYSKCEICTLDGDSLRNVSLGESSADWHSYNDEASGQVYNITAGGNYAAYVVNSDKTQECAIKFSIASASTGTSASGSLVATKKPSASTQYVNISQGFTTAKYWAINPGIETSELSTASITSANRYVWLQASAACKCTFLNGAYTSNTNCYKVTSLNANTNTFIGDGYNTASSLSAGSTYIVIVLSLASSTSSKPTVNITFSNSSSTVPTTSNITLTITPMFSSGATVNSAAGVIIYISKLAGTLKYRYETF